MPRLGYPQIRNNKIEWPEGFRIFRPFFFRVVILRMGVWLIRNPQSSKLYPRAHRQSFTLNINSLRIHSIFMFTC